MTEQGTVTTRSGESQGMCQGVTEDEEHGAGPRSCHCKAEFLSLGTTDILGWIILCCPVHYRLFGNILGLYPLDVSSNFLSCCSNNNKQPKNLTPVIAKCLLGTHPQWRATASRRLNFNLFTKGNHLMILSKGTNMIRYTFHKDVAM